MYIGVKTIRVKNGRGRKCRGQRTIGKDGKGEIGGWEIRYTRQAEAGLVLR